MFSHEQEMNGQQLVIRLHGELDFSEARALRKVLAEAVGRSPLVTIDLSGLDFLDCGGYGILVAAANLARQLGGSLVLIGARGSPRRLLEIVCYSPVQPQTTGS